MGMTIINVNAKTNILAIFDTLEVGIQAATFALTASVARESVAVILLIDKFLQFLFICAFALYF
jgi:hypothetical protein